MQNILLDMLRVCKKRHHAKENGKKVVANILLYFKSDNIGIVIRMSLPSMFIYMLNQALVAETGCRQRKSIEPKWSEDNNGRKVILCSIDVWYYCHTFAAIDGGWGS